MREEGALRRAVHTKTKQAIFARSYRVPTILPLLSVIAGVIGCFIMIPMLQAA